MKTTLKKALSVLMAVLVFVGGLFVAFNLDNISADDNAYDAVYDYASSTLSNAAVAANLAALGAHATSGSGTAALYVNEKANWGINPNYNGLDKEWGTIEKAYIVYKVKPGTKFEATFELLTGAIGGWNKNTIANHTGEPFEFVIESSADGTTWGNAWDTSAETSKDIVKTYDVPADCNFVKITFPQKGKMNIAGLGTDVRANDFAQLLGVKYVKDIPIEYDTTYDYTTTTFSNKAISGVLADLGMYATSGSTAAALKIKEFGSAVGINPDYSKLDSNAWDTLDNPYVIYEVKPGSYFEAEFFLYSKTSSDPASFVYCKEKISEVTGEPFEFVIEASSSATGGWKNAKDTSNVTGNGKETFAVEYKVPADCSFVKITFPNKGYVTANGTKMATQDRAKLMGVKYFKAPEKTYNTEYDYAYVAGNANDVHLSAANKAQYGIYDCSVNVAGQYAGIVLNSKSDTKIRDGLEIRYDTVMSNAYGTLNKPYIIYEVKPGTWFEGTFLFTVGKGNSWCKEAIEAKTGEGFDFTIEASANSTAGWKNAVSTSGATATQVIAYAVPEDCSYVKISFPQTGYIANVMPNNATVAGNDIARVGKVRYTKAPEKTYTTEYNYAHDATGTSYESINTNASKYGIYATSGSNAAGLVKNTGRDGIEIDYGRLDANAWGTLANPYVVYEVTPGTWFEAGLYLASTTAANPSAYTKQAISAKTGEPFEFEISASVDGNSWKNVKNTASITDTNIKFEYLIPEDCNFVKVSFPQKGKISGVPHNGNASDLKTLQANDLARLLNVKYTAPVPEFNTSYDYTKDLVAAGTGLAGGHAASIGAVGLSDGLFYDEKKGGHGINAGRNQIIAAPWGTTEFYIVYEVTPGTKFEADVLLKTNPAANGVWDKWTKETFGHLAGEPWEFKIEASASETGGWKNALTTASQTSDNHTMEYQVPDDCKFVKVTFPQKGRVEPYCEACGKYHLRDAATASYGLQGDDLARLRAVRFTAPENHFDGCDKVMDYKANGPVNFFYDNDAFLIHLYEKNGIAIKPFTNGATYVAPDADYVKGTGFAKPFVTFAVEPASKFVASINVDRDAAAAIGADFKVKVYESANGTTWTENTTAPIAELSTDYYSFTTAATTKFVKIEFPHTDAVKAVDKVNEIFGLMKVGLNPDEDAYVIENPFGNYTFGETHKFYGDPRPASFNANELNIYEVLTSGLGYESEATKPAYYLPHTYGTLVGKTGVEKAGFVYSVKPGTAFQVLALVSRDDGFIQMIEKKLGTNWDIMLEVSSDGKNWISYNPSRVLTEEHLLDSTPARYKTEVITIPVLPSDAKFVKVIYPQTGDMKLVTEEAFPYCGNDLIGVTKVSLTWGGAVPASQFKPDKSKYNSVMDATEGSPDDSIAYVTGLQYAEGMQVMAPSWSYLNGTGGAVMAQTGIYAAVKEGSAFYAEAAFKNILHVGELDENGVIVKNQDGNPIVKKTVDPFTYIEGYGARLYFSSDRMTWTEVTDKYLQVIKASGSLPVLHRFNVEKLPAGVKYVKVELPINRNMISCPVGNEGLATCYTGNDFCGIRRFYFNADEHVEYKSEINYGNYFDKEKYGSSFPTSISAENNKVLGLYSYTPGAFEIKDYTSSDTPDGRITIKESYLFNKKEVDAPYLVYNVEPNSPFYMGVNVSGVGRLSAMPGGRLRLYVSETGKDGSWTEFTNYTYVENQAHTFGRYFADNLGAKTNYLMIVYPITGDLSLDPTINAKGASGANFFEIRDIFTNVVNYDPTWDDKNDYVFIHPNGEQQVIIPGQVTVNPFNWLFVIIPAAAVLVLAAAAVVIILIIKKKKAAAPKA